MKVLEYLAVSKQKTLWKKLKNNSVIPVVDKKKFEMMPQILSELQSSIKYKDYHPQQALGFLSSCKNNGVTRFIPIMAVEDLAIYYACTTALQDKLCFEIDGVYGGWRMSKNYEHTDTGQIVGDYVFDSSLSTQEWFNNWSSFTELLTVKCREADDQTWFHVTDIANFYDNIDLFILENKIKKDISCWDDTVDILIHFLKFWNRGIRGYSPSSKGIPQEMVQDASRILANYYIKEIDQKMLDFSASKNCKYIRWADDIIFIGKNKRELENLVYIYSAKLHKIGLNLNASKTKCYTKREIEEYRCLDIINALKSKKIDEINCAIDWFKARVSGEIGGCREDTVSKHLITLLSNQPSAKHDEQFHSDWNNWQEREGHQKWLKTHILSRGYNLVSILDSKKLIKFIDFFSTKQEGIEEITTYIINKPYTSPKAELLRAIAQIGKRENNIAIQSSLSSCVNKIFESAKGDVLVSKYCTTFFDKGSNIS